MRTLGEYDRSERRILAFFGGACLVTGLWIVAILALITWVIIRVTLHFT